jgi:hypothetical protein
LKGIASVEISLVVPTLNRAHKLSELLASLPQAAFARHDAEVIIVDNGSTDGTKDLVKTFASQSSFPVHWKYAPGGTARARNAGVRSSTGRIIAFTDDDCLLYSDYLEVLIANFDPERYGYCGGAIIATDPEDDPDVASTHWWPFHTAEIAPGTLLRAGWVQGANMAFTRRAIEAIGGFDERFGLGSCFGGADIRTACSASLAGFAGILLGDLRVAHRHGRRLGSVEAEATKQNYDRSRGHYYASLIAQGIPEAFDLWKQITLERARGGSTIAALAREFAGAAEYMSAFQREISERNTPNV